MRIAILIAAAVIFSSPSAHAKASDAQIRAAIKGSDDFQKHSEAFLKFTRGIVHRNQCTLKDLKYMAGWVKSTLNYKHQPVYFVYCGMKKGKSPTRKNRIYLNVKTGKVFT